MTIVYPVEPVGEYTCRSIDSYRSYRRCQYQIPIHVIIVNDTSIIYLYTVSISNLLSPPDSQSPPSLASSGQPIARWSSSPLHQPGGPWRMRASRVRCSSLRPRAWCRSPGDGVSFFRAKRSFGRSTKFSDLRFCRCCPQKVSKEQNIAKQKVMSVQKRCIC